MEKEFEIIVKTFKGFEPILEKEIKELTNKELKPLNRGFSLIGGNEELYKLNYHLRTATSVLKPLKTFYIKSIDDLYKVVKKMPWEEVFTTEHTFSIEHAIYADYINHTQFAALRVKDAIVDRFNEKQGKRPDVERDNPDFVINVHISRNQCDISLNSSGNSLFKRAYRSEAGEAPLKENLAAGLILLSEWDKKTPLVDPFCGSGTIAIEAAMIAMNMPPGYFRFFSFENWKDFDKDLWDHIMMTADINMQDNPTPIYASDINQRMIEKAETNLEPFKKLKHNIQFKQQDFFNSKKPSETGIIITNPPYDVRLKKLRIEDFYNDIASHLKHSYNGFDAWVLSSNLDAFKNFGLKPSKKIPVQNGKLDCSFRKFELYLGSKKAKK